MSMQLEMIRPLWTLLRARLDAVREDERGYSMEAVIVIALLAAAALAAFAAIGLVITNKASTISAG